MHVVCSCFCAAADVTVEGSQNRQFNLTDISTACEPRPKPRPTGHSSRGSGDVVGDILASLREQEPVVVLRPAPQEAIIRGTWVVIEGSFANCL